MALTFMSLQELIREDFLTCKICYDLYTVPKILPCLHSYCQHCLEPLVRDGALQCPECRLQTDVPGGASSLKTNFFINSLLELFQIKHNRDLACTVCSDAQKILTATARCLDCKDFLCQSCTQGHCCSRLTLHHKVVKLEEFLAGEYDAEMRLLQELCCQDHQQEALRFFCDTCSAPICRDCRMLDHFQHKVVSMANAVQRERPSVEQLIDSLAGTITCISEQEKAVEETIDKLKTSGENIKERITKYVDDIISYLLAQKEAILGELSAFLTQQMESCRLVKEELQSQRDKAISTREFSQRVLYVGKDYEILHLEGMIRNRIQELQTYIPRKLESQIPELAIAWDQPEMLSEAVLFSLVFPREQPEGDMETVFEPDSEASASPSEESEDDPDLPLDSEDQEDSCPSSEESAPDAPDTNPSCCSRRRKRPKRMCTFEVDQCCSQVKPNITGIAVLPQAGGILLLDQENDEIKQYSAGGHFQQSIPLPDSDGVFCGISLCGDVLACSSDSFLFFLTLEGKFLRKLLLRGSESSYAITSYEDSYIAVSEGTLCSISLYSPSGHCVGRVAPTDYHGGKFLFIAVNDWEEFIVSDFIKKQIVIIEKSGLILNVLKTSHSLLTKPFSVCVDASSNIFVVDQLKVIKFSPDGETGEVVLSNQSRLKRPRVLAVDDSGRLVLVQEDGYVHIYCF
ncbi:E3 ubiquitin-protein ligase TRIM56-like isoform X2 [Dermochelys coriacea]|nr:E3 ubiquitin-protein ligase TRIM56-like isoform X2 [Dermochelys coriacea]XP_043347267.1 E3 ubiquitin-protein ligase TRIM56-like isoform X2 [Dermochelys coriacea]XP_043347268.1 E3 ubiquitin-protein ligase TRIM56-like isoform X2 [Dermochelys coriacea]